MHRGRRKVCSFCVDRIEHIDYKDLPRLRKYVTERAKIIPRRVTGTCAFHQRELTVAIKRARHMAFDALRQRLILTQKASFGTPKQTPARPVWLRQAFLRLRERGLAAFLSPD